MRMWLGRQPKHMGIGKCEHTIPASGRDLEGLTHNNVLVTVLKCINGTLLHKAPDMQAALLTRVHKRELGLNVNARITGEQLARLKSRSISCALYHKLELTLWARKQKRGNGKHAAINVRRGRRHLRRRSKRPPRGQPPRHGHRTRNHWRGIICGNWFGKTRRMQQPQQSCASAATEYLDAMVIIAFRLTQAPRRATHGRAHGER
ncbi:hypothetical protein N9L68_08955 [bacterium]|nr:hypothetical protein [bacterium]